MTPLISIVIPAYNAGLNLEKCIESLLKQYYFSYTVLNPGKLFVGFLKFPQ